MLGVVAAVLLVGGGSLAIAMLASSGTGSRAVTTPTSVAVTAPPGSDATLPPDTTTTAPTSTGPPSTSPSLNAWLNATDGDVGTLNSDLQSLKTDNNDPTNYDFTLVGDDASSVKDDVQILRDDPEPPSPALQQQWSKVLGDLDGAAGGLVSAANAQNAAAVTAGLAQMGGAENEFLAFANSVAGGGG